MRYLVLELHAAPQGRLQDGGKGRNAGREMVLDQVEMEAVHIFKLEELRLRGWEVFKSLNSLNWGGFSANN